jgi:hypothetical protein
MKNIMKVTLALGLLIGFASLSHAASTDALTVTIRPNAFYSFTLSTANVGLDLGTIDLGASTQTVSPATVTITSTYLNTDLQLSGFITSGGTAWTFDTNTASNDSNQLQAWAMFSDTSLKTAPVQNADYFRGTTPGSNSCVVDGNSRFLGTSNAGAVANAYEVNSTASGFQDMDGLIASAQSHMWMYFRLPSATTSNQVQNVTLVLTASAPVN